MYDAAKAVADSYKAVPSQTLTVNAANGVLANDVNIDQATLRAVLQSNVTNGQLTLNADGSFTYNPRALRAKPPSPTKSTIRLNCPAR